MAKAVAATIDEAYQKTGKKFILVTHSQGGNPGWETVKYTDNIAAIVAIESGAAPVVGSEEKIHKFGDLNFYSSLRILYYFESNFQYHLTPDTAMDSANGD